MQEAFDLPAKPYRQHICQKPFLCILMGGGDAVRVIAGQMLWANHQRVLVGESINQSTD